MGKTTSILLVSNQQATIEQLQFILDALDYEICLARHPVDALVVWLKEPRRFHLMIVEFHMPQMDGLRLAEELRKRHYSGPIILNLKETHPITYDMQSERIDALLVQPYEEKQVVKLIRKLTGL